MNSDDEIRRRILDLLAEADVEDLTSRLLAYTRAYLESTVEGKPSKKIVDAYVRQGFAVIVAQGPRYARWRAWETLFQLLSAVIVQHVDQYHQTVDAIVKNTSWQELIPRLLAHTVANYGGRTSRHGRSAEDYVSEAIEAFISRRRYFPFDRVTLFTFLCRVIRSIYAHEAERMAGEGAHVILVRKAREDMLPRELAEEHLVAPTSDQDDAAALLLARDFILSLADARLRRYAELRALGSYDTASQYADALDVTEQTIRNWDRQLKRRRDRWNLAR